MQIRKSLIVTSLDLLMHKICAKYLVVFWKKFQQRKKISIYIKKCN